MFLQRLPHEMPNMHEQQQTHFRRLANCFWYNRDFLRWKIAHRGGIRTHDIYLGHVPHFIKLSGIWIVTNNSQNNMDLNLSVRFWILVSLSGGRLKHAIHNISQYPYSVNYRCGLAWWFIGQACKLPIMPIYSSRFARNCFGAVFHIFHISVPSITAQAVRYMWTALTVPPALSSQVLRFEITNWRFSRKPIICTLITFQSLLPFFKQ